jgi:hypothetical protein
MMAAAAAAFAQLNDDIASLEDMLFADDQPMQQQHDPEQARYVVLMYTM